MDVTAFVFGLRDAAFLVGDHNSYRVKLSRRLRTVQKKLGRATPRNAKYAPKLAVTAEDVAANIDFLHLLLLTTERAWAHALAMKDAHSKDNADRNITGSTRQHIISRLHKATQNARHVVAVLQEATSGASATDVLEAQAYFHTLAGAEHFEKQAEGLHPNKASHQRWDSCLTNYATARVIYSALLKTTKKELFKEVLASTTDPSIRYAAYQSRIPRTIGVADVASRYFPKDNQQLLDAVQQLDSNALTQEQSTTSISQITWRGRTANIVDAAIGQAMNSVAIAAVNLESAIKTSTSSKDRSALYDSILITSQDVVDATRRAIDELESEGVDEGDTRMQDLRVTNLAVNYDLISWRIGRNRILVGLDDGLAFPVNFPQKPRRSRKDGKERAEREEPTGRKLARLRERIALYDAILQSIDSIKDIRGAVRDIEFVSELDAQRAYYQSLKCLNLSHTHVILSGSKQALALCSRALSLSQQAVAAPSKTAVDTFQAPKLFVKPEQAQILMTTLENLNSHYRGLVALSELSNSSTAAVKAGWTNAAPVVERLNEYPPSGTVDLQDLVTWPPKLKPVPVKPLFLDVAWNYIGYPGRMQIQASTPRIAEEKNIEEPKARKGWFSFGR